MYRFTNRPWLIHLTLAALALTTGAEARGADAPTVDPDAGHVYYSVLKLQANRAIAGIVNTSITPIAFPAQGDFHWVYQNDDGNFNKATYNYISARVSPSDIAGVAQLSDAGGFPNAYDRVINSLSFDLSPQDQAVVNRAKDQASVQAQSVIATYQGIFGQITEQDMREARDAVGPSNAANKMDYILNFIMGYVWSGRQQRHMPPLSWAEMQRARSLRALLPNLPPSGEPVLSTVTGYLNILGPSVSLQDLRELGNWIGEQLKFNTANPDQANDGMKTVDPNTGSVSERHNTVGYAIPVSTAKIRNDLDNDGRSFALSMEVSQAERSEVRVHVDGSAGFTVNSFLRYSRSQSFDYDMTRIRGASSDASVTVEYPGFTFIPIQVTAWQQAANVGWYNGQPIAEAYANRENPKTGFNFVTQPPFNLRPLSEGGNFGRLTGLLISRYPTIKIHFRNANFEEFKESFQQNASGNLTLFGFINLGSSREGTYQSQYEAGRSNSEFTVTFKESDAVLSQAPLQKTAFVIGGVFNFPAVDRNTSFVEDLLQSY